MIPDEPLAKALRYYENHWDALTRFVGVRRTRADGRPQTAYLDGLAACCHCSRMA